MMIPILLFIQIILTCIIGVFLYKQSTSSQFQRELQTFLDDQTDILGKFQQLMSHEFRQNREENFKQQSVQQDSLLKHMTDIAQLQKSQLDTFSTQLTTLTQSNEKRLETLRETVDKRLTMLQTDNNTKLEQMRATVDEKLHATLEKRLGESFKIVSERLELVHKGLGEMQHLAHGVGDLKKVLSNVKTRGTWGEIQCGQLLEQLLTKEQYESQVKIKKQVAELVDFAIKLPGKSIDDAPVWLPIDAKLPLDIYQQLVEAQETGQKEVIDSAEKQLKQHIKKEAKSIVEKYVDPPHTTDFAILYLPVEGLYAEVLRMHDLQDELQHKFKILIAGPTTLAALINSLQMGFRTLAIEKRSSEVWSILSAVKTEFIKFGDILDKTQKKLQEAGNTIETAARKSRTIERKLRTVEDEPVIAVETDTAQALTFDQINTL